MAPEDIFFILEDGFLLKKIRASVFEEKLKYRILGEKMFLGRNKMSW